MECGIKEDNSSNSYDDRLLFLLGEEVKQPLIAISQLSEVDGASNKSEIGAQAKRALRTIDNVLLYQRISSGQTALDLEPVHVGSTILEVSTMMEPLMRVAGCRTEIKMQKSLLPVDVDKQVLRSALQGMWQALLLTVSSSTSEIVCRAHKTSKGLRLSLYCKDADIESLSFTNVNTKSTQPFTSIAGPATDLLTSRNMFDLLGSNLVKIDSKKSTGFGVTLTVSKQLQIV